MKILALEREIQGTPATAFRALLQSEAAKVWELYQQGVIRELYFNAEEHTAVLVLECQDEKAARQILAQLPLVQAGLIEFEVISLAPYDGFARLFSDEKSD
jgi:muconolactone delta-isomerase